MADAKITEVRIEGMRALADVRLELGGLTVLIGENGSGKSSIIEACELLRRAGGSEFMAAFYNPHGGTFSLLRDGARRIHLGVTLLAPLPGESPTPIEYGVSLAPDKAGAMITEEQLLVRYPGHEAPLAVIERDNRIARFHGGAGLEPLKLASANQLVLSTIGQAASRHPAIDVVREALQSIETHLGVEVLPSWLARAYSRKSEIRGSVLLAPADRLDHIGTNLVNVYYALREQSDKAYWDDTMDLLRLGLGIDFEEVRSAADMGGGAHALAVKWRGREQPMPASLLSDGQIAFLAIVAMYRLRRSRSLLAIDEPELHLHPGLVVRVAQILEAMGETQPVLVATHSDRLLDALSDPVASVRVCELVSRATRLRRLDADALAAWLADYQGVGALRSEGHLGDVLADEPETAEVPR